MLRVTDRAVHLTGCHTLIVLTSFGNGSWLNLLRQALLTKAVTTVQHTRQVTWLTTVLIWELILLIADHTSSKVSFD